MAVPKVKLENISVHVVRCGYNSLYPSQRAKFLATLSEAEKQEVLSPVYFISDYNVSFENVNLQSVVTLFSHVHRKQAIFDSLNEADRVLVCSELQAWHQRICDANECLPDTCTCVACVWMEENHG